MTQNFDKLLNDGCSLFELTLDEEQKEQLFSFYEMVIEKNKVMNLTSIVDETEFVQKHILDSLSIVHALDLSRYAKKHGEDNVIVPQAKAIDVGTGAGFPGMVLKIVFPALSITLFDSLKKRLDFLDDVIAKLELHGIDTLHGRAEDFGRDKKYRERYDYAFSRAVANMSTLSEYCLPFVRTGGIFAAYKSGDSDDEIKAADTAVKRLGGVIEKTDRFTLPCTDMSRAMIIVRKDRKTPPQFPRKAGTPSKEPIS